MKRLRVAVLGRTGMLLEAGRRIHAAGHEIGLVATCAASGHEEASQKDYELWAAQVGAPFIVGPHIGKAQALEAATCDIAVSMNWLTILPSSVRCRFPLGVFNAHPGDLPRFKGNACPNWAILLGEPDIALTVHKMDDGLDSGPVAMKSRFELDQNTYIEDVYAWLRDAVPAALLLTVESAARGCLQLTPQPTDPKSSLRCYPRRPEDGRIDWDLPAEEVLRLVRASGAPFAGAFTLLEGSSKLTIWRAEILTSPEPFIAVPGQIAFVRDGDPVVACNNSLLRLTKIGLEGAPDEATAKRTVVKSLRNRLI